MEQSIGQLLNEARYAQRLCERTARLYRRLQTFGVFCTVVGGSAAVAGNMQGMPPHVQAAGAAVFAVFGAALLAVRPADKAAANEADTRRYAKLQADGSQMDVQALSAALKAAREPHAPEIETLRAVAFNDVALEAGRPDLVVPLTRLQRMAAAIA